MSLDPSPLSARPTPLLHPTDPVPGRGAALIGALLAAGLAVIVVFVSLRFGSALLFIPAGLKTQTKAVAATSPYQIQGFDLYWRKGLAVAGAGYDQATVVQQVAQDEAQNYNMNLAVITVTLDQLKNDTGVKPDTSIQVQLNGPDTYSDDIYLAAIKAVQAAGLTPALKIELRVTKSSNNDTWPGAIGEAWAASSTGSGKSAGVLAKEQYWFDSYSDAVAKYAALAQSANVKFLIFGSDLKRITVDTADTSKITDTNKGGDGNVKPWPGDANYTCNGRRECGWRHVIDAIRGKQYLHSDGKTTLPGGNYTGRLIYAATVRLDADTTYEWQNIDWWDAVDIIGIDAYFPLMTVIATSADTIDAAWNGQGSHLSTAASIKNGIFGSLQDLATKAFNRPVVFTSVGYSSVPNANNQPPTGNSPENSLPSQEEQQFDMQGLLQAFQGEPWWLGAIWSADYAFLPRSKVPFAATLDQQPWQTNTMWGGDCLTGASCDSPEKLAGQMLRGYYHHAPISPNP